MAERRQEQMRKRGFRDWMVLLVMCSNVLIGCGTVLTGCSGMFTGDGRREKLPDQEEQQEITEFTFFYIEGAEDSWTNPVAQALTAATGVRLNTRFAVDEDEDAISLMIATSNYPDLVFAKGDGTELIEAGVLLDLSELIEEYGPNIKAMYGERYDQLRYSAEDPSIYQLCCSTITSEIYTTAGTAQLQYHVLEELDYQIPYTLEAYENMLRTYMQRYPEIEGNQTIGLTVSCSDWHWLITLANPSGFIGTGRPDNGQWIVYEERDYETVYKHMAEGQKEFFQWMNRMYHEGILDPEFATQTHEDYLAKIQSGRVLGLLDAAWSYQPILSGFLNEGKYERTYASLPVSLNEDMKNVALYDLGLSIGWGVGITTACEDPVKAIQFLDYICSEEGQILVNWGIEEEHYFVDEEGRRYRTEEEIRRSMEEINYDMVTGVGYYAYPFPSYGAGILDSTGNPFSRETKESVQAAYNPAERAAAKAWRVELLTDIFPQPEEFEPIRHAPLWSLYTSAKINEWTSALGDIARSGLVSCIVCPEAVFEEQWEQLQAALSEAGAEELGAYMTEYVREQVALWNTYGQPD